jgi:hypothetical protein
LQQGIVHSGDSDPFLRRFLRYLLLTSRSRTEGGQLLLPVFQVRVQPHIRGLAADSHLFDPQSQHTEAILCH